MPEFRAWKKELLTDEDGFSQQLRERQRIRGAPKEDNHEPTQTILVLPHLRIQTPTPLAARSRIGFPSITAFTGVMWALGANWPGRCAAATAGRGRGVPPPSGAGHAGLRAQLQPHAQPGGQRRQHRRHRGRRPHAPADHAGAGRVRKAHARHPGGAGAKATRHSWTNGRRRRVTSWRACAWRAAACCHRARARQTRAPWMAVVPEPCGGRRSSANGGGSGCRALPLVGRDDLLAQRLQTLRATSPTATLLDAWLHAARFNYAPVVPDGGAALQPMGRWWADPQRRKGSGWSCPSPWAMRRSRPATPPAPCAMRAMPACPCGLWNRSTPGRVDQPAPFDASGPAAVACRNRRSAGVCTAAAMATNPPSRKALPGPDGNPTTDTLDELDELDDDEAYAYTPEPPRISAPSHSTHLF